MMDYLDFELRIGAGHGNEYPVTVIHAAAGGQPSISASIPINDPTLRLQLDQFIDARTAHAATRGSGVDTRQLRVPAATPIDEATTVRAIGEHLFAALIVGAVRDAYVSSLMRAREQAKGLRLRLRIEAPEVAVLPWECLYDPQEGDHVCLLRETPLTRYTDLARDPRVLTLQPPLRILGMVATPTDLEPLNVAVERQCMEHALEYRLEQGDVELVWVDGGTWQALQYALDRGPWHIFHFVGHGDFDPGTGEGLLAFADDQGASQLISATALARLFSGHPSLRLAFLNACEGGRTSEAELFSSVGAVLTRRGIPAVISMQFAITDRAALEFSRLFYDALARGNPVDVAVTIARTGLSIAAPGSVEWATPMLHMRAPDGHLFTVDVGRSIFDEKRPRPGAPTGVSPPQRRQTIHLTADQATARQAPSGLDILWRKVQQFWIDGVLENSLFLHTLHDLGLVTAHGAVESPWRTQIEQPGEPSRTLAEGQSILDVFDNAGGSLLILGEPGSGKTTSMLDLTRLLLERIPVDVGFRDRWPVPVVFNLSSWMPEFPLLEEWLAAQMSVQYQIPRVDGRNLLAAGTILPMLDGLDETDGAVRPRCVEAINRYVLERSLTGIVICCRLKEYNALSVRLALNTAVRLTELKDEQVDGYLAVAGEQLAGLRDLLRRETAIRFDARSPLWLNLMVRAYHGLSTADLAGEGEGSAAQRRRRLMDDYMARMFRRARGTAP